MLINNYISQKTFFKFKKLNNTKLINIEKIITLKKCKLKKIIKKLTPYSIED